jgi:hypothetical protein
VPVTGPRSRRVWRAGSLLAVGTALAVVVTGMARRRGADAHDGRAPAVTTMDRGAEPAGVDRASSGLGTAAAGATPGVAGAPAGARAAAVADDTLVDEVIVDAVPVAYQDRSRGLRRGAIADRDRGGCVRPGAPVPDVPATNAPGDGVRRRSRRRRRWPVAVAGLFLLAGAVAAGAVVGPREDDPSEAATGAGPRPEESTTTTFAVGDMAPSQVVELVGRRLETAGSFTYTGTASATDVSPVRPGPWLTVNTTIEGRVDLSTRRLQEVAVSADGRATETLVDGPTVWGRSAPGREALSDAPYQIISPSGDARSPKGVALLTLWLGAATDHRDAEAIPNGHRRVAATVPADVLGEIERDRAPVDAEIVVTLDTAGDPLRVEVTSSPDGPPLHLVLDLTGLGGPVAVAPPGAAPSEAQALPDA